MKTACIFSIDDSYEVPFTVFYHSLEATKSIPSQIPVYILHTASLSHDSIERLRSFMAKYERFLRFLDTTHLLPSNLPIRPGDPISQATFYRLFIADLLPEEFEYAVYLDSDMLALKNISSLFFETFDEPIAACDHCSPENAVRLHGSIGGTYFQGGLLIIPLRHWRENGLTAKFLSIMESNSDSILWWDQDVLNLVFAHDWKRLSIWLNVCYHVCNYFSAEEVAVQAKLVHFTGASKPWNSMCTSPFVENWDANYHEVYGKQFDRTQFLLPFRSRIKAAIRSRIRGLIHGC